MIACKTYEGMRLAEDSRKLQDISDALTKQRSEGSIIKRGALHSGILGLRLMCSRSGADRVPLSRLTPRFEQQGKEGKITGAEKSGEDEDESPVD